MKTVKILVLMMMVGLAGKAQFPTTDSLRRYIDKYIRESAINSFQNLRLNTALKGLASQIDSARNSLGPDTLNIYKTQTIWGAGTFSNPLDTRQITVSSLSELRTRTPNNTYVYKVLENTAGYISEWRYNPFNSTSNDDSSMVVRNGSARFERVYTDYVLANWFGAVANDGIDDSYAIQKAINFAIANFKAPVVKILGGVYLTKYLNLYKDADLNGEYEFVTATIEGVASTYDVTTGLGPITVFQNNDGLSYTLNVELGRNIIIRNIAFVGAMGAPTGIKDLIERHDTVWNALGAIRNNRNSPNALIVIDAFRSTIAAPDRYPGVTGWYTNAEAKGTSMVIIDGCVLRNAMVGLMVGPNGHQANGDNVVLQNSSAENLRTLWASGHTQTRANLMRNIYTTGNIEYVFNGTEYGYQQGSPPNVQTSSFAGGTKYLYKIQGGFAGMAFDICHFESLWSFGSGGDLPVSFENCETKLIIPNEYGINAAPVLASGYIFNYKGGSLEYFDNTYAAGFPFDMESLNFDNTFISGGPPFVVGMYNDSKVRLNAVRYKNYGGYNMLYESGNTVQGVPIGTLNGRPILPGNTWESDPYFIKYTAVGQKFDNILVDTSRTMRVSASIVKFTTSNTAKYRVGDMLVTRNQAIDYNQDIYSSTLSTTIGWVYTIVADTVTLLYSPYGVTDGMSLNIYIKRIPKFIARTLGDLTNGSVYIKNVQYDLSGVGGNFGGVFSIGEHIKGIGIPIGARVVYVGHDTIQISVPATLTATTNPIYDAIVVAEGSNRILNNYSYEHVWFAGDIIKMIAVGGMKEYTATASGKQLSATPPAWFNGSNTGGFVTTGYETQEWLGNKTASNGLFTVGTYDSKWLTRSRVRNSAGTAEDLVFTGSDTTHRGFPPESFLIQHLGGAAGISFAAVAGKGVFGIGSGNYTGPSNPLYNHNIESEFGARLKGFYLTHPTFGAADSLALVDKKYVDAAGAGTTTKAKNTDELGAGFYSHKSGDTLIFKQIQASNYSTIIDSDSLVTVKSVSLFTNSAWAPIFSPADATTYYIGGVSTGVTPGTTAGQRQVAVPMLCSLIGYSITTVQNGAVSSQENSTVSVRQNNASDITLSSAVKFNATSNTTNNYTSMSLSTAFSAADTWEIKILTPSWVTNPLSAEYRITLYFLTQ